MKILPKSWKPLFGGETVKKDKYTAYQVEQMIVNQTVGKFVDYDKHYGAQCVDLDRVVLYGFGFPQFTGVLGAKDMMKLEIPGWKKVYNDSLTKSPQRFPAIFVQGPNKGNGYAGHTGFFLSRTTFMNIDVLEQNAVGKGTLISGNAIRRNLRNWPKDMLGWFEPTDETLKKMMNTDFDITKYLVKV